MFAWHYDIHSQLLCTMRVAANPHQGDMNPCGQSPMDFESITLATRSQCQMPDFGFVANKNSNFQAYRAQKKKEDQRDMWTSTRFIW